MMDAEPRERGTEPLAPPGLLPRGRALLLLVVGASIAAFLSFWYRYMGALAAGAHTRFELDLLDEVTGVFTAAALFVPLVWLTRWLRWRGVPWYGQAAVHLPSLAAFALLHTSLMWGTRSVIYPLAGFGAYDYGRIPLRYLMELGIQIPLYVAVVGAALLAEQVRRSRARDVRMVRLEGELARARLGNLESQLRPHFLFNALNTVSSVMYEDVARADRILADLARLLRRSLRSSEAQETTLGEELGTLELFLAIARARFEERLDVRVEAAPELAGAAVPALILQPLVENALQHGDPGEGRTAVVRVRAEARDGRLVLTVTDNGPGAGEELDALAARGIGLGNTRRRLALLHPGAHRFEAGDLPGGGFEVRIELPLRHAAVPGEGAAPATPRDVSGTRTGPRAPLAAAGRSGGGAANATD